jgi:nicotinate-nucleotide pyrophosphorylase (carboxylating)
VQSLSADIIRRAVQGALEEDVGEGDATTLATVPANALAKAVMVAREPLVLAGLALAEAAFLEVSQDMDITRAAEDGRALKAGDALLHVQGPAQSLLTAERTALNFVQRLSGIATLTAQFVQAVDGTRAQILDTRKTTPGLRLLEKYAVTCGGGQNHRFGLDDLVLIKDNHLVALHNASPNPIAAAVLRARLKYPQLKVEVEAETLPQVTQAVAAGADIILLDNMTPEQLKAAVTVVAGRARTEASGGVTLETIRALAESGVDFISVGALTHSARAMDIAFDFEL